MLHVVAQKLRLGDGAHFFLPVDLRRGVCAGKPAKRADFAVRLSERAGNESVEGDYERCSYAGDYFERMTVHDDPPELERQYIRKRRRMNTDSMPGSGETAKTTEPKVVGHTHLGCPRVSVSYDAAGRSDSPLPAAFF